MGKAKDIQIKLIDSATARKLVKQVHYSGKVVANSKLNFGVFLDGKLEGVMQYGSPINKKGSINLVKDTKWNAMLELNRMAFSDKLPKNSESRAMAIAHKIIKKQYPHIEWILSFSDGTQCGDGTIYRAAGFVLTDIRESDALRINPKTGEVIHVIQAHHLMISSEFRTWESTKGYQLRYIYFLNKKAIDRLTVPVIPFSKIDEVGAGMYKGESISIQERRMTKTNSSDQLESGGAIPTHTLQSKGEQNA